MNKFRKRIDKLKNIQLLLQRKMYPFFHNKHPLFRKKDYLLKLFKEKALAYNIDALNFEEGVVLGSFQGKDYLINCHPGNLIETTIYLDKIWEGHLAKIMSVYLDGSNGVMIDVGANIGASTLPLAAKHPQIRFHCYEPHPEIFDRLKNNIKLNNFNNIEPVNSAVSNSTEKLLKFYAQKSAANMGKSSLKLNTDIMDHDEIKVPIVSIDETFADSSNPVLLIKIDTQGTELEVIKSAEKTIEKFRPTILFELEDRYFLENEMDVTKQTLKDFFEKLDYSLLNSTNGLDYLPQVDITRNYHGDIIAIPR
jgi:FkbM family methyltransferase